LILWASSPPERFSSPVIRPLKDERLRGYEQLGFPWQGSEPWFRDGTA
jgi:hypothetical protein